MKARANGANLNVVWKCSEISFGQILDWALDSRVVSAIVPTSPQPAQVYMPPKVFVVTFAALSAKTSEALDSLVGPEALGRCFIWILDGENGLTCAADPCCVIIIGPELRKVFNATFSLAGLDGTGIVLDSAVDCFAAGTCIGGAHLMQMILFQQIHSSAIHAAHLFMDSFSIVQLNEATLFKGFFACRANETSRMETFTCGWDLKDHVAAAHIRA